MRCFVFIVCFLIAGTGLFAQSEELAKNFMDQGEYEKALKVYQELLEENPGHATFFTGVVNSYQQLENFEAAEQMLLEKLDRLGKNPNVLIELGHNADLQRKSEEAEKYYRKAIDVLEEKPNFTYSVARNFEKYSLLDHAAETYLKGMKLNPEMKFDLPLARIYGEQGRMEEMFDSYLELIDKEPEIANNLIREFDRYILEDPENPANVSMRRSLLKRLQENPRIIYNELLAWLFIQQKEYRKAFAQEKAIYRRNDQDLQRIIQLTIISKSNGEIETAKEVVAFIIEETPSKNVLLQAKQLLLDMKTETAEVSDYQEIADDYEELFGEFGKGIETIDLQINYALFLAFKMGEIEKATAFLSELSKITNNNFDEAAVKMALADVFVLDQRFNQALIYYSQIQNLAKNDEISQEARFKVAKTSYYKGDFEWAKTQLDVLKASSTQLIANDAMELSLLIHENSLEDSTQTALKLYAKADLLSFQNKNEEAIAVLEEILELHKGEKIEDEALLKQAEIYEAEAEWKKAEANYLYILEFFRTDILADNATFKLAELYNNQLGQQEKASEYYEQIIFDFPDSIYFVDARKNFRRLRGDEVGIE